MFQCPNIRKKAQKAWLQVSSPVERVKNGMKKERNHHKNTAGVFQHFQWCVLCWIMLSRKVWRFRFLLFVFRMLCACFSAPSSTSNRRKSTRISGINRHKGRFSNTLNRHLLDYYILKKQMDIGSGAPLSTQKKRKKRVFVLINSSAGRPLFTNPLPL